MTTKKPDVYKPAPRHLMTDKPEAERALRQMERATTPPKPAAPKLSVPTPAQIISDVSWLKAAAAEIASSSPDLDAAGFDRIPMGIADHLQALAADAGAEGDGGGA